MANINSADTISCDETSQDDENYGYEDDLTAQLATSTSINDIKIRAMNFLSSSDKTMSVPVSYTHLTLPTKRIV